MKVISNASPLINLAWIGSLNILADLYGQIIIPQSVWEEIVVKGEGQPGSAEVKSSPWIEVQTVSNRELVQSFQQELDGIVADDRVASCHPVLNGTRRWHPGDESVSLSEVVAQRSEYAAVDDDLIHSVEARYLVHYEQFAFGQDRRPATLTELPVDNLADELDVRLETWPDIARGSDLQAPSGSLAQVAPFLLQYW